MAACQVCRRPAWGYGLFDTRFPVGDPRRYHGWRFCSRTCQDRFHRLFACWQATNPDNREPFMIDKTDDETAAMRMCLKALGEAVAGIGFDKPFADYSEAQALAVIEAVVTCYGEVRLAQANASATAAPETVPPDTFADLEDASWSQTP